MQNFWIEIGAGWILSWYYVTNKFVIWNNFCLKKISNKMNFWVTLYKPYSLLHIFERCSYFRSSLYLVKFFFILSFSSKWFYNKWNSHRWRLKLFCVPFFEFIFHLILDTCAYISIKYIRICLFYIKRIIDDGRFDFNEWFLDFKWLILRTEYHIMHKFDIKWNARMVIHSNKINKIMIIHSF